MIWVIGGTSGIGRATADLLDIRGIRNVVSGTSVDVRNRPSLYDFEEEHGPFDGLVYSAGVNYLQWAESIDPDIMNTVYDINVTGLVRALHVCQGSLKRVVVVGSDAASRPMRTSLAYCASKAALEMAMKVLARELASDEFAINLVAPGMTAPTDMSTYVDNAVRRLRGWPDEKAAAYEKSMIPLGRRARPEEVAQVICDILQIQTNYLNGATIEVNGARS